MTIKLGIAEAVLTEASGPQVWAEKVEPYKRRGPQSGNRSLTDLVNSVRMVF